eukprot:11183360-Lingulodinium_polyedra.AAC.1
MVGRAWELAALLGVHEHCRSVRGWPFGAGRGYEKHVELARARIVALGNRCVQLAALEKAIGVRRYTAADVPWKRAVETARDDEVVAKRKCVAPTSRQEEGDSRKRGMEFGGAWDGASAVVCDVTSGEALASVRAGKRAR